MSSDDPDRSVPDELFRKVSAKPERQLPDALFGGPPPARKAADSDDPLDDDLSAAKGRTRPAGEDARSVPDELFKQKVSARAERQLPDLLFGGPFPGSPVQGADDATSGPAARVAAELPEGAADSAADPVGAETASAESGEAQLVDAEATAPGVDVEKDPAATVEAPAAQAEPLDEVVSGTGLEVASATSDPVAEIDAPDSGVVDSVAPHSVTDSAPAGADSESSVSGAGAEGSAAGIDVDSEGRSARTDVVGDGDPALSEGDSSASPAVTGTVSGHTAVADAVVGHAVSGGQVQDAVGEQSAVLDATETSSVPAVPAVTADDEEPVGTAGTSSATGAGSSVAAAEQAQAPAQASTRPVMIVIADSLAYFGPKGGLPADHPQIWPNLVGAELDWDVELVGRIGWTSRDAYWALIGDPRIWAAVPKAAVVVFAVGGMDTLPSPLPTALRELIRYIRPAGLRRLVRTVYNWCQPKLAKLGRPVALPPRLSIDYLEQSRQALTQLRPDLPVIAVLPSVHDCAAYGRVHSGRPRAEKALRAWSEKTSVPLVDLAEAVRENIFSGEANPDGIHWGWDGHTAVANAMLKTLQEVR